MKRESNENGSFQSPQKQIQSSPRNQHLLLRTSGTKPFQLSKLRNHKRNSIQLINNGGRLDMLGYKSHQELYEQSKDIYLDLVINKKAIVDTYHTKVLESERQNTFYIQSQDSMKEEFHSLSELPPTEIQVEESQVVSPIETTVLKQELKQELNQFFLCKKRGKCQSCYHLNTYLSQAILNNDNSESKKRLQHQFSENNQIGGGLNRDSELAKLQLKYVKQKADKSPFSFTNIKWRTKSQGLQIDKWKEKYRKPDVNLQKVNGFTQIYHIQKINKSQEKVATEKVSPKKSLILPPKKLPSLTKIIESKGALKSKQNKVVQIIDEQMNKTSYWKSNNVSRSPHHKKQQKEVIINLAIKKPSKQDLGGFEKKTFKQEQMEKVTKYEHKFKVQEKIDDKEVELNEKGSKGKKKNLKFQSMQGDLIKAAKSTEEDKKNKNLDQKIDYSLKEKLSRKVYLQKMMEQIPQRWQYGESRQNSREVDSYLKIKEEQERIELENRLQQERKQLQIKQEAKVEVDSNQKKEQNSLQPII